MKKLIVAATVALLSTSAMASASLVNTSFETNTVGVTVNPGDGDGYAYGGPLHADLAAGWVFTGGGAVSQNNTAWYGVTTSGNYFAVLQNIASISQTFTSDASGVFSFSFDMALRPYYSTGQVVGVTLDGNDLGSFAATSTGWTSFASSSISLAAGSHTLTFSGLNPNNSYDTSAFIDNIDMSVSAVPEPATYGMMMAGLGLLGFVARRRKA